MKKILALLGFVLAVQMMAWAQGPSINFSSGVKNTGEEICIQVTVKDFSDMTELKIPIRWDSTILEYKEVRVTGKLPALDVSDFNPSRTKSGLLFLNWSPGDCAEANSITINDFETIFEVCFTVIGKYGQATSIAMSDDRDFIGDLDPIIFKRYFGTGCSAIGYNPNSAVGDVAVGVRPIRLFANEAAGNTGDIVVINVKVSGFDKLTSCQFSMNYDSTLLEFTNVLPLEALTNLSTSSFGRPNDTQGSIKKGNLTVSWSYIDPLGNGTSLPDSTTIFQVSFKIIGPCGSDLAEVSFSDSPTKREAINTVKEGEVIPIIGTSTYITIDQCDPPGLKLAVDCGAPVQINQEVCVKVLATEGMNEITRLAFLTEWNPNTLQFIRIANPKGKIPGFSESFFNKSNVANGVLGVDWITPSVNQTATLDPGEVLFEVCFKAIGLGGTLSPTDSILEAPVQLNRNTAIINRRGSVLNMGLAPSNCEVQIKQPPGVRVVLTAGNGKPGDEICTDVTVGNFQNVIDFQFSLSWEPADIQFTQVKNLNTTRLPGLSFNANFDTAAASGGALTFNYETQTPVTALEGTVIFQVCYKIIGPSPGELGTQDNCDNNIEILDFPLESQAILSTSNGKNVGITGAPANVCILNPTGFFLLMGENTGYIKDTVCVDFKVESFKKVTSTQFKVNWPTALKFVSATPTTGLTGFNLDVSSANVGVMTVDYSDPSGKDLADSSTIFTMCFELISGINECHKIDINNSPNPSVTTLDGVGSVFPKAGEVCVKDTILIVDTLITQVSCPGLSNGTIQIKAVDGAGADKPFFYTWTVLDQTGPLQFTQKAINLPAGRVQLRIFSGQGADAIIRVDTFDIPENATVPLANAGRDTIKGCRGGIRLNGSGAAGANIQYTWKAITGQIEGEFDRTFTIVSEPGIYAFTVFDKSTGCGGTDTVEVRNAPVPVADAGNDAFLDCRGDTLRLDGSKSTQGTTIKYKWSGPVGTTIDPTEISSLNPKATNPGFYTLQVQDSITRCTSVDTVEIKSAQTRPVANAGEDLLLGCNGETVTLDASKSQNSVPVIYEWLDESNTILSRGIKFDVSIQGTYLLRIVDEANGCLDVDTILVKPSLDYPSVIGSKDIDISCKIDKPVLTTSISNTPQFKAKWTSADGGLFQTGTDTILNAIVTAPGTYVLVVTNTASNCVTNDTVLVKENKTTPTVDVGAGGSLTCTVPSLSLTATVGGSQNLSLTWTKDGQAFAKDSTSLRITAGGTYRLQALDTLSGCSVVDSAVIAQDGALPQVTIANLPKISCKTPNATLTATVSPATANYSFEWTTTDGNIVSGGATVSSSVNRAGSYSIKVTNSTTGCIGEGLAQIIADTTRPVAQAGVDQALSCKTDTLSLNGTGSSTGTQYTYTWTAKSGGATPAPANALQAKISQPGVYVLTVRDTANGCFRADSLNVTSDKAAPQASIAQAPAITCKTPAVQVTATGSQGALFQVTWKGPNGQAVTPGANPLQISASVGGTYELTILNTQNSCSTVATTTIADDSQKPVIQAVTPVPIACAGVKVSLNGAGSATGAGITYKWTVGTGNGTITPDNTLTPQVNAPGTYKLVVTNSENGCTSESMVTVSLDNSLARASAGRDTSTCNDEAPLIGNLPAGTTGQWSGPNGITIEMPALASTMAIGLNPGSSRFIWSLSTADCPNYSRDSLNITRQDIPDAVADRLDNFVATADKPTATINVVANDLKIPTNPGYIVTVAKDPSLGVIDGINGGSIVYRGLPGRSGTDQFVYQVCNKICVDLCDTAAVRIQVKSDNTYQFSVPTGITPNGDGANDELRFEVLEVQPEQYKDNEIVIFNRWGDIVYRAKPYVNNWRGTNSTGQDLPTGTYYYVLRLDISNGVIIKGDITIVK
ncbi:gliding motility-associated C-terminal domain-containing protein [Haliscomenobacter sp.]|uniref:T9SS type B sorting domain-containing protein n=1 Tax=Haliscomenobacter sp. TaxID=2717303 RepID=UPI0035948EA4